MRDEAGEPRPERPWRIAFGGFMAMASAVGVGRFVYTPILPGMAAALGLTAAEAGLVASANFLGYLAGAFVASAPRFPGSRRFWLFAGLLASALTTLAMGATDLVPAFVALRFVGGLGSAFVMVFSSSLVLDRLSVAGRPGLSAVHFAGVGGGIAASAAIVAALPDATAAWRLAWVLSGAAALAGMAAVAWLVPREGAPGRAAAGASRLRVGTPLAALIGAYFLFGIGYVVTATFLVVILRGQSGGGAIELVAWLVVGVTAVPSVVLWNALARRIGAVAAFSLALVVEAAGVAGSVLAAGPAGALAAAALLGGTFMGITALGLVAARALAPGHQRQVAALMTSSFGLGSILAPIAAGLLADRTGSFTLPSLLAAGALAAAAILALAARRA